jgi:hypothetical protein
MLEKRNTHHDHLHQTTHRCSEVLKHHRNSNLDEYGDLGPLDEEKDKKAAGLTSFKAQRQRQKANEWEGSERQDLNTLHAMMKRRSEIEDRRSE